MKTVNKLRLKEKEIFFGPGVRELFQAIDETHSLTEASRNMKLSYVKAHRMVQNANLELGFAAVESYRGGTEYGGTQLTPEGRKFLELFVKVEEELNQKAEELLESVLLPYVKKVREKSAPHNENE